MTMLRTIGPLRPICRQRLRAPRTVVPEPPRAMCASSSPFSTRSVPSVLRGDAQPRPCAPVSAVRVCQPARGILTAQVKLNVRSQVKLANELQGFAGIRSTRGPRDVNEDRCCVAQLGPDTYFFGVFDGHGGSMASDFCNKNLHWNVHAHLQSGKSLRQALEAAIVDTDEDFCRIAVMKQQETVGSTVIAALLSGDRLCVANTGDSIGYLCTDQTLGRISALHKPDDPAERERIIAAGGDIIKGYGMPRVMGALSMSRAVGDVAFRRFGVIVEPHVFETQVTANQQYLLLTSDGLTDVLNEVRMHDIVRESPSPEKAAVDLAIAAEVERTEDNTTAVVVKLPGWDAMRTQPKKPARYSIENAFGGRRIDFGKLLQMIDRHLPKDISADDVQTELERFAASGTGQISTAAFRVFDRDGDGYITREEMSGIMLELGEPVSEDELSRLFTHVDENGDGRISHEEFVRALRAKS